MAAGRKPNLYLKALRDARRTVQNAEDTFREDGTPAYPAAQQVDTGWRSAAADTLMEETRNRGLTIAPAFDLGVRELSLRIKDEEAHPGEEVDETDWRARYEHNSSQP